jgi:hypothetical protein
MKVRVVAMQRTQQYNRDKRGIFISRFTSKNKINHMSKKKPSTPTAPKYKYGFGARPYYISYHRGKPEELIEVKIIGRDAREFKSQKDPSQPATLQTIFSYEVLTPDSFMTLTEGLLYPSYVEAAKVFAKAFLKPLK